MHDNYVESVYQTFFCSDLVLWSQLLSCFDLSYSFDLSYIWNLCRPTRRGKSLHLGRWCPISGWVWKTSREPMLENYCQPSFGWSFPAWYWNRDLHGTILSYHSVISWPQQSLKVQISLIDHRRNPSVTCDELTHMLLPRIV